PPPPAIAIPIENQQAASRPEDAVHLRHHARLRRIVMKAVRASDQIESVILERQALAITLDEMEASPGALAPGLTLAKHAVAEVDAPDLCIGELLEHAVGKNTGAAANIQDATVFRADCLQQHAVRRPEKEKLEQIPVVAVAPAVEFFFGV